MGVFKYSLAFAVRPLITQFRPSAFRKKFKKQTVLTSIRGLSWSEWQAILKKWQKTADFCRPSIDHTNQTVCFSKKNQKTDGLDVNPWTELLRMASHPGKWQKTADFCRPSVDHTIQTVCFSVDKLIICHSKSIY